MLKFYELKRRKSEAVLLPTSLEGHWLEREGGRDICGYVVIA